jgi:histidinol-phosphate aminotransferase
MKMTERLNFIKPAVRALRAYTLSPHRASVKINQNENPWDASSRIKEECLRRFAQRQWSRYPDFVPVSLNEQLASFASWKADGVIVGNGSNELIQALLTVIVEKGRRVLISEPTFALYRQVTIVLGGDVESVPMRADLQYDVDRIQRVVEEKQPDVVIICSPNNPTGGMFPDVALDKLLRTTRGLVVIDEAYHEFAQHSVVPLLNDHENLVVLRTFSKAMAFAALRLGYLLAAPELVREIRKAVLPYNLNALSQIAAEVALEMYESDVRPQGGRIIAGREYLFSELKKIDGLWPVASHANFMIVRSKLSPKVVFDELIKRDVLVRDVSSYPMLSEYFRFNVGTPEENEILLSALREIVNEVSTVTR